MLKRSIVAITTLCLVFALLAIAGCGPTQKVKRTLALNDLSREARTAAENGDDQKSLELWQEYVDRRPHSHFAEYQLGMTEARLGMYIEAIGHLTTAHDLRPGEIKYIEGLADTFIQAGRPQDMMDLLQETSGEGGRVAGQLRVAKYAQQAGMLDEAKQAIRMAMSFGGGESAEPYMAMADLARKAGDKSLEEKALRQALWFDPASDELDQRFLALGITPGPSLAIAPSVDD
ncbi:MAG: tetratricopeptide repeat protein [Phycisphaerales bacterium]